MGFKILQLRTSTWGDFRKFRLYYETLDIVMKKSPVIMLDRPKPKSNSQIEI